MQDLQDKVALVTGAGSGIGRATALRLAQAGARIVICDIDEDGLQSTARDLDQTGSCLLSRRVDVSEREEMEALADEVAQSVAAVDVLVNNAGVYLAGGFLDLSLEDWDWVLSVNLWGVILGCNLFVPQMAKRGQGGHVVNVSSMFGYWASPSVIGYLTAKFGVFGFSEALREDMRASGVQVSTVCPGIIRTGLVNNMRVRNAADEEAVRARLDRMYERRDFQPERVADAIVRSVRRGRGGLVLVSPESRLMYHVNRLLPGVSRYVARSAARRMFRNA